MQPSSTTGQRAPAVPSWVGAEPTWSARPAELLGCRGEVVATVDHASRLVQQRMVNRARASAPALQSIADDEWFALFRRAAETVRQRIESGALDAELAALASACGLPVRRATRGILAVVDQMLYLDKIMAVQSPDGTTTAYRTGRTRHGWSWLPAGRTAMVRVPANFPTIAIEWLQVLASRRPTLISTARHDPFVAAIFVEALYEAGLPAGAVSICHDSAETFHRLADQVVWPGEQYPPGLDPTKLKLYHFGRSKAVLPQDPGDDAWARLARLAFQGCGRLCTNVSSIAVPWSAHEAAERLAAKFANFPVLPLADPLANVPAFTDLDDWNYVAGLVEREIAAGAQDVTAQLTDVPLRVELDGTRFLRPTVLLVKPDSHLVRLELPFPFVTVTEVPREELAHTCRQSLIVSLVGEDAELLDELVAEPSISKVFHGEQFDRGYDPIDPQEGYLADFLFQKKLVLPN
ncbi:thienamycin biosynthesis protein ThnO [Streptomyces zagrosensis]|uniref:Thienamycin biosynthesis protein ThnO n=1 Tax=Streptomyces zagrosensis TaxID=1042984 RepID=A0A7W9Q9M0_9ACTN|nr:thienamycin biosynthesis protein ThnO [Streptomyces zagrosensis]